MPDDEKNPNVPSFKPDDEVRLYIPFAGDELLLTRDWTFTVFSYDSRPLLDALGMVDTKRTVHTVADPRAASGTYSWSSITKTLKDDVQNKVTVTLKAGCIVALDRIQRTWRGGEVRSAEVSMRVTYHPKEQGFRKSTLRPRFCVALEELNNKVFFLPCSEPDVEIEFDEEVKKKKKR